MYIHLSQLTKETIMFLIKAENPESESRKLAIMYEKLRKVFGSIPPHLELLGSIHPDILEETLTYLFKLINHPNINPELFPFIRLHVANKEGYKYCIQFNTNLLKARGYSDEIISSTVANIHNVPFKNSEKSLASKAIKAIYDPTNFGKEDLNELYTLGWNDKDIYDAIDHAGFLLKNGRIISCYIDHKTT